MPYRHAHYWLLLIVAAIPIAFWPTYFAPGARATPALHAHAAAASVWLALLILQSWSASRRRFALHRAAGRAVFAAVPLFAGAGAMAIVDMARRFATEATPFHAANGARLAACDIVALGCFVGLATVAVAERRRVRAHAAAMLATPLLVLPPVVARLMQHVPGFPADGALGLSGFALSLHLGEALAAAIALALYARDRRHGGAFLVAAVASAGQSLLYATLGASTSWAAATRTIAGLPMGPVAAVAAAIAGVGVALAWVRPGTGRRPLPA